MTVYASPGSASKNSDTFRLLGPKRPDPVAWRVEDQTLVTPGGTTHFLDGEFAWIDPASHVAGTSYQTERISRPTNGELMPAHAFTGTPATGAAANAALYQVTWRPGETDVQLSRKVPVLIEEGYEFLYRIIDYDRIAEYTVGTACIVDAIDLSAAASPPADLAAVTHTAAVGLRPPNNVAGGGPGSEDEEQNGYHFAAVVVRGPDANGWVRFRRQSGFRAPIS